MDRRGFARCCASAALLPGVAGWADQIKDFPAATLVASDGMPIRASDVRPDEALVFAYPYRGVPCFLINLGDRPAHSGQTLNAPDDGEYNSLEGVGRARNLVAFIAICTHQLSYPTPDHSVLRYAAGGSKLAGAPGRIVCCAHGSVFDPANGAKNVGGPAQHPLLPVRLAWDDASDALAATGTVAEKFLSRFFSAYKSDLIDRFGPGGYRREVGDTTKAWPLSQYSASVSSC